MCVITYIYVHVNNIYACLQWEKGVRGFVSLCRILGVYNVGVCVCVCVRM